MFRYRYTGNRIIILEHLYYFSEIKSEESGESSVSFVPPTSLKPEPPSDLTDGAATPAANGSSSSSDSHSSSSDSQGSLLIAKDFAAALRRRLDQQSSGQLRRSELRSLVVSLGTTTQLAPAVTTSTQLAAARMPMSRLDAILSEFLAANKCDSNQVDDDDELLMMNGVSDSSLARLAGAIIHEVTASASRKVLFHIQYLLVAFYPEVSALNQDKRLFLNHLMITWDKMSMVGNRQPVSIVEPEPRYS